MIRLYTAATSAVAIVENGGVKLTLEECGAQCLAVDHNDPEALYVGTSDEGLFKSSDGGRSWDRLVGVAYPRVTTVAVSPVDIRSLLAMRLLVWWTKGPCDSSWSRTWSAWER
ncbi:MAG: hypothetical protein JOZ19_11640 [Rubrobacter sp.]|nr:hypothetical protein [Rubrobacter sp.]